MQFYNTLLWYVEWKKAFSSHDMDENAEWLYSFGFQNCLFLLLGDETLFLIFEMKEIWYKFKFHLCSTTTIL